MRFNVKNIVSPSCEWYVKSIVNDLGLKIQSFHLGELKLEVPPTCEQLEQFKDKLQLMGMELTQETKNIVVEKMKTIMHEIMVLQHRDPIKLNLSELLTEKLGYNYSYLSNIFSKVEGKTIREYCIQLRIDSIKRMLLQEGMDLTEIAFRLDYSSVAHLSAQFKKVTGITTTEFKRGCIQTQHAA